MLKLKMLLAGFSVAGLLKSNILLAGFSASGLFPKREVAVAAGGGNEEDEKMLLVGWVCDGGGKLIEGLCDVPVKPPNILLPPCWLAVLPKRFEG